jgi:hypothetical protein
MHRHLSSSSCLAQPCLRFGLPQSKIIVPWLLPFDAHRRSRPRDASYSFSDASSLNFSYGANATSSALCYASCAAPRA